MRPVIIALGSRGNVQPCIALGPGLIKAGYAGWFVTEENFEDLVKSHGLEFRLIRGRGAGAMGMPYLR